MSQIVVEPGTTRIGWIGTGVMGSSMCGHLVTAGFSATVYNRSREKADALVAQGAQWADSPRAVAEQSDIIFTIVGFPADVRTVVLGEDGCLAGGEAGNVLVDMTTSEPSLAVEIAEAAEAKGMHSVDAPVSGGDVGATNGTLSIMIGGDPGVVEAGGPGRLVGDRRGIGWEQCRQRQHGRLECHVRVEVGRSGGENLGVGHRDGVVGLLGRCTAV